MTTTEGIQRIVAANPWRTVGFAVIAGAIVALLPRRFVRGVAFAIARDAMIRQRTAALVTFIAGGDTPVEHGASALS